MNQNINKVNLRGLSQAKIAKAIGTSPSIVSRSLRGYYRKSFAICAINYIAKTIKEQSRGYKQLSLSGRITNKSDSRKFLNHLHKKLISERAHNRLLSNELKKAKAHKKPSLLQRIFGGNK